MEFLMLSNDFLMMFVRLLINVVVTWLIIDRLYYRKSRRRDFYFTFMLISIAIFFIVFFMIFVLEDLKGKTSMGVGIGLFGIFSIMRYRTDTMPVREMTYLFVIIALSLVNAVSVNVPLFELILTNAIISVAVWLCEMHLKSHPSRMIQYDRIDLITPERRPELIADLEKRLGVKVVKVDIGSIDFLRDMAMIRVSFEGEQPAMSDALKLTKDQLKEF
ncbi:protein of unknown function [Xylanibacter ruminicola]|uniref:DUF4956 domain-containing protein n=1 Tax=Xylanibacter ruminicola TaxID=839 RepID=A0A1H5UNG4_XYLRU|nr:MULTISPECIES: DUF4956 domain-containing protein [Prevotellaceae]MCR5469594.1 DUF4956 domain-containing protein [Prevotella sp.]SEF76550.1 protein of unknown function [Xylanibacter ruminicola]SEV88357.1 protein of unknown function [Prevotella sp. khp7]